MKGLILLPIAFLLSANFAIAQGPLSDSIIVEDVYVDSGATYADVPVWLIVNNQGFCAYLATLTWNTSGSGIHPSQVIENNWPGCDNGDRYDTISISPPFIRLSGFCQDSALYHINIPFWTIRFDIAQDAPQQVVDVIRDSGPALIGSCDGVFINGLVFIPGHIYYGIPTGITEPQPQPILDIHENYPNPFGTATSVHFSLAQSKHVTVEIFNVLGQRVRILADEQMSAGDHQFHWDGVNDGGSQLPSGVYFYRVSTPGYSSTKKMVYMR
jgi:hypothetical protein